jgi:hypothetical protein
MQRYAATIGRQNIIRAGGVFGDKRRFSQFLKCMVRRPTAREKFVDEESLRQCIRPVCGGFVLLAMMRYAASLFLQNASAV